MMKHDVANVKDEELADAGRYTIIILHALSWLEGGTIYTIYFILHALSWLEGGTAAVR